MRDLSDEEIARRRRWADDHLATLLRFGLCGIALAAVGVGMVAVEDLVVGILLLACGIGLLVVAVLDLRSE